MHLNKFFKSDVKNFRYLLLSFIFSLSIIPVFAAEENKQSPYCFTDTHLVWLETNPEKKIMINDLETGLNTPALVFSKNDLIPTDLSCNGDIVSWQSISSLDNQSHQVIKYLNLTDKTVKKFDLSSSAYKKPFIKLLSLKKLTFP